MPVYECLRVCEHAVDVFLTESVIGMSGITLVWTPRVVGPLHLCVTSYLTWHANCTTSIGQPCVEPHAAGERARNSTERCSLKLQRPLSRDRFHFSYIISYVADLLPLLFSLASSPLSICRLAARRLTSDSACFVDRLQNPL